MKDVSLEDIQAAQSGTSQTDSVLFPPETPPSVSHVFYFDPMRARAASVLQAWGQNPSPAHKIIPLTPVFSYGAALRLLENPPQKAPFDLILLALDDHTTDSPLSKNVLPPQAVRLVQATTKYLHTKSPNSPQIILLSNFCHGVFERLPHDRLFQRTADAIVERLKARIIAPEPLTASRIETARTWGHCQPAF